MKRWKVLHGLTFLVKLHLKINDCFAKGHEMEDLKNYNKFLYAGKYTRSDCFLSVSDPVKASAHTNANY